jgi:hypothetical protein
LNRLPPSERSVALTRPGFFPPDEDLEGMADLRSEHQRRLSALSDANDAVDALRRTHEKQDETRREALLNEARDGKAPKLAKETPPEMRARELQAAQERVAAVQTALDEFLDDAMDEIRDYWPSWERGLAARAAEVEQERAEAERLLAETMAKALEIKRLRIWAERNATGGDHWLIAYPDLPAPTPIPQPDLADATGVIHSV